MDQYNKAKEFLLELPYQTWINISDVPEEIKSESIDLIDGGFHCKYLFNDGPTAFKKYTVEKAKPRLIIKDEFKRPCRAVLLLSDPIQEYESVAEAGRVLSIDKDSIWKVCRGYRKTAGGFKFAYKPINNESKQREI